MYNGTRTEESRVPPTRQSRYIKYFECENRESWVPLSKATDRFWTNIIHFESNVIIFQLKNKICWKLSETPRKVIVMHF